MLGLYSSRAVRRLSDVSTLSSLERLQRPPAYPPLVLCMTTLCGMIVHSVEGITSDSGSPQDRWRASSIDWLSFFSWHISVFLVAIPLCSHLAERKGASTMILLASLGLLTVSSGTLLRFILSPSEEEVSLVEPARIVIYAGRVGFDCMAFCLLEQFAPSGRRAVYISVYHGVAKFSTIAFQRMAHHVCGNSGSAGYCSFKAILGGFSGVALLLPALYAILGSLRCDLQNLGRVTSKIHGERERSVLGLLGLDSRRYGLNPLYMGVIWGSVVYCVCITGRTSRLATLVSIEGPEAPKSKLYQNAVVQGLSVLFTLCGTLVAGMYLGYKEAKETRRPARAYRAASFMVLVWVPSVVVTLASWFSRLVMTDPNSVVSHSVFLLSLDLLWAMQSVPVYILLLTSVRFDNRALCFAFARGLDLVCKESFQHLFLIFCEQHIRPFFEEVKGGFKHPGDQAVWINLVAGFPRLVSPLFSVLCLVLARQRMLLDQRVGVDEKPLRIVSRKKAAKAKWSLSSGSSDGCSGGSRGAEDPEDSNLYLARRLKLMLRHEVPPRRRSSSTWVDVQWPR